MNPYQFALQIRHLLQLQTWPAGGAVFGTHGNVVVFAGQPTEEQIPASFPWALVSLDGGDVDPDDPGLINQRFSVLVGAESAGDRMGEHALVGGPAPNLGSSAGRGVLEVGERVRAAVQSLTGADGCRVQLSSVSTGAPAPIGRGRHLALDELGLVAVCTSAPSFSAPQRLRHDGTRWLWDGAHCETRFDFFRYRLVRRAGQSPSLTPSDGTVLYTGTAAQWTGARSSGYTYTVFADYNSRGVAAVEGSSLPEVGSYRVV